MMSQNWQGICYLETYIWVGLGEEVTWGRRGQITTKKTTCYYLSVTKNKYMELGKQGAKELIKVE